MHDVRAEQARTLTTVVQSNAAGSTRRAGHEPASKQPLKIAHQVEAGNAPALTSLVDELLGFVHQAAQQGLPAHQAELAIWRRVLALGREA